MRQPPPGQENDEFNKYGVNITICAREARTKADRAVIDGFAESHRDSHRAREVWSREYHRLFEAMANPFG